MFNKIIKNIKAVLNSLEEEEKAMLGTAFGFLLLGFLIYAIWQTRLPTGPDPEEVVVENQTEEGMEEENQNPETDTYIKNETHGYRINNLADEIIKKNEAQIFGLRESSDFIIEYKGVTHAVFNNSDNLPIRDWVEKKIDEKGPRGESLDNQKSFLDIFLKRETSTPLGEGIEVVRMNGFQAGELFIPWNDYVMSFHYEVDSAREVSRMESRRDKFIESIN